MSNMGYCRHENTARDLSEVFDLWDDYVEGSNEREDRARKRIVRLVEEMHDSFDAEGLYDEVDE